MYATCTYMYTIVLDLILFKSIAKPPNKNSIHVYIYNIICNIPAIHATANASFPIIFYISINLSINSLCDRDAASLTSTVHGPGVAKISFSSVYLQNEQRKLEFFTWNVYDPNRRKCSFFKSDIKRILKTSIYHPPFILDATFSFIKLKITRKTVVVKHNSVRLDCTMSP